MRIKITNTFIAFGLGTALLAGCGGGGGGGTSSVTYTGVTTAAVIDETSAPELASTALRVNASAADAASASTAVGVAVSGTEDAAAAELLKLLANDALRLIRQPQPDADIAAGVVVSGSGTIEGCTGTATISGTVEDNNTPDDYYDDQLLSATISYSNYRPWNDDYSACVDVVVGGSVSMTVTWVGPDGIGYYYPSIMAFNFSNLSASSGGITKSFNGNFSLAFAYDGSYTPTSITFTMTADFSDSGLVYRTKDYTEEWNAVADTFSVGGTVCHPIHGCVRLETTTPFALGACTLHPGIGVLRVIPSDIDGVDGIGWVQIDASAGTCDQYGVTYSIDGVVVTDVSYYNW